MKPWTGMPSFYSNQGFGAGLRLADSGSDKSGSGSDLVQHVIPNPIFKNAKFKSRSGTFQTGFEILIKTQLFSLLVLFMKYAIKYLINQILDLFENMYKRHFFCEYLRPFGRHL